MQKYLEPSMASHMKTDLQHYKLYAINIWELWKYMFISFDTGP